MDGQIQKHDSTNFNNMRIENRVLTSDLNVTHDLLW